MKVVFLILSTCLLAHSANAQDCKHFNNLMAKARMNWTSGKFEQAINQLAAAREDCPQKGSKVDAQLVAFTTEISTKYREATVERNRAIAEATRADSSCVANRRAALHAYADGLAYKSAIALKEGDRNTAFRLAEFGYHYVDSGNNSILQALINSHYQPQIDIGNQLPRVHNLEGSESWVESAILSPDGKYLLTGSWDSTVSIWALEKSEIFRKIHCDQPYITGIAFSNTSEAFAIGLKDNIQLWKIDGNAPFLTIDLGTKAISSLAYSPNDSLLAIVTEDSTLLIWDFQSARITHEAHFIVGKKSNVLFSRDANKIVTTNEKGEVIVWNTETLDTLNTFKPEIPWFCRAALSPDGMRIAIGNIKVGTIVVIDLQTRKVAKELKGHRGAVHGIAFSPDGKQLASASSDGTIRLWNLKSSETSLVLSGHDAVTEIPIFSMNGKFLVSVGWEDIKVWDFANYKRSFEEESEESLKRNPGARKFEEEDPWLTIETYSPDSKHIATKDCPDSESISIWSSETKELEFELSGHEDTVCSVTFSPDGHWVASGSKDSTIRVWDVSAGNCIQITKLHTGTVNALAFSPSGKQLASASSDHTVELWSVENGHILPKKSLPSVGAKCVRFSLDNQFLAIGDTSGQISIWNLETLTMAHSMVAHRGQVNYLEFAPNDTQLLSGGDHKDGSIKLWDWEKEKLIARFQEPEGITIRTHGLTLSENGVRFAAGIGWETIEIFDMNSHKPVLKIPGFSCALSPAGNQIATGGIFDLLIWELSGKTIIKDWQMAAKQACLNLKKLQIYSLENLLDLLPENESKLVASKETWQIKAFADLAASQAEGSNISENVTPHFERADRLYGAALSLEDEPLIRRHYARMLRNWAEVHRSNGNEAQASALEAKATKLGR